MTRVATIAAIALAATPAAAGLGVEVPDDGISPWRVVGALLLCLALAIGAAIALRVRMRGGGFGLPGLARHPARLHLRETIKIGSQSHLCIVRCDRHELLLATGPGGAQLLRQLDDPVDDER